MFTIFILVAFLPAPVASLAVGANHTTGHAGCCYNCDGESGGPVFREPAGCLAKTPCGECPHIDVDVDKCNIHSLLGAEVQWISKELHSTVPQAIKDFMKDDIEDKAHVTGLELTQLKETILDRHKKEEAARSKSVERAQEEDRLRAEDEKRREAEYKKEVAAKALHERLVGGAIRLRKRTQKLAGLAAETDFLGRAKEDAKDAEEAFLRERPPDLENPELLSSVKLHETHLLEALLLSQDPGRQAELEVARKSFTWESGQPSQAELRDQHIEWLRTLSAELKEQQGMTGNQQLQEGVNRVKDSRVLIEKARGEELGARAAKRKMEAGQVETSAMLRLLQQAAEKFSEEEGLLAAGGMPELSKEAAGRGPTPLQLRWRTFILMLRALPRAKWPTVLGRLPQELPEGLSEASTRLLATARAVMDLKQDRLSAKNVKALKGLAAGVHALKKDAGSLKDQLKAEAAGQSKEVRDLLMTAAEEAETHRNFISQADTALRECVGYDEDDDVTVLEDLMVGAAYKCQKQAEGLLLQFEAVAMRIEKKTEEAWATSKVALDKLEGKGTGGKRRRTMARGVRKMLSAVRRAAARFST